MSYTRLPQSVFSAVSHISIWGRIGAAFVVAAVTVAVLLAPGTALAFEGSELVPAEQGQHFQIEDNTSGDPEANLPYLFAVFIITWGLFFGYVIYMTLKQRRMQAEIEALSAAMHEKIGTDS